MPALNDSTIRGNKPNDSSQIPNLNETFKQLKETLDKNTTSKFNIRREYKLTIRTPLNTWLDFLNSELTAHDLLDVIDDSILPPSYISNELKNADARGQSGTSQLIT